MADEINLSEHLHKLIGVKSEQKLEDLLLLLWQTRKTGLSNSQKSSIHSLLYLPSPCDLDPILVCLRSLIRNCVHKNLEAGEALKLLPADLPLELQSMLLVLLQKHRSHWKGELSLELEAFLCTLCSSMHQVNVGFSAPLLPLPYSSSAECRPLLSLQADPVPHFNSASIGGPTPDTATCFPHLTLQSDIGPTEIQGVLPQVKSMTWTVEIKGDIPTNRVAIITLKLHDYTKSPINEMEVKFQLTRDTLEAVLRSMSYISQQLSQFVRSSTKPLHKKQAQ